MINTKIVQYPYNKSLSSIVAKGGFLEQFPVGFILFWGGDVPPEKGIFLQSQLLIRTEYYELWEYVQKYEKLVTETEYLDEGVCGCYSTGDGETTFRVPNYAGYKIIGFESETHTLGKPLEPALPNIKGTWAGGRNGSDNDSGSIYTSNTFSTYSGGGYWMGLKNLNASRSSLIYKDGCTTVQTPDIPKNIVIKYKS